MEDDRCPHCGGSDLVEGIRIGLTSEVGSIGLEYKTALVLLGTEPLLADLCRECGSIARLRVRNVDRKWLVKK